MGARKTHPFTGCVFLWEVIALTLNGETIFLQEEIPLVDLLDTYGFSDIKRLAIERNGTIIKRSDYAQILIQPEDILEVVQFVGGG